MPKFKDPPYKVAISTSKDKRDRIYIPKKIRDEYDGISTWKIRIDFLEEKVTFIERIKEAKNNVK